VFEFVIGFDTLINACAECDLNIRIRRDFPVYCHGKVVLEYRHHNANMSRNSALMLKTALVAHRSQLKYIKGNTQHEEVSKIGKRGAQDYFGGNLVKEVQSHIASRELKQALQGILILLRYHPHGFASHTYKKMYCLFYRAKNLFRSF